MSSGALGDAAPATIAAVCEMVAIVEATDLVVGDPPSAPFSLGIGVGEIVGLLVPRARSRTRILRALAGLDAPAKGQIRARPRVRIVLATRGPSLLDALSSQPDLVLFDDSDGSTDRNIWARLASERALGVSFIVATASVDQAFRADRVSLVHWEMEELTGAVMELARQLSRKSREFLALRGRAPHGRTGPMAVELRRLNVGSRALLAEMQRCAHTGGEKVAWHTAAWRLAADCLSDRVLDAAIAEAQDG